MDNNGKEFAFGRKFVENCARLNEAKQLGAGSSNHRSIYH